jgi:hypothetical protein
MNFCFTPKNGHGGCRTLTSALCHELPSAPLPKPEIGRTLRQARETGVGPMFDRQLLAVAKHKVAPTVRAQLLVQQTEPRRRRYFPSNSFNSIVTPFSAPLRFSSHGPRASKHPWNSAT